MKHIFRYVIVFIAITCAHAAFATEAFETNGNIVVNHPKHSSVMALPPELASAATYHIVINPRDDLAPGNRYETTGWDVDTLIQKSNQLYHKGDFEGALTLLIEAAGKEPHNVRINNMLGSIYFKLGDAETARTYWETSLSINGSQSEVRDFLSKLPEGSTTTATTPATKEKP